MDGLVCRAVLVELWDGLSKCVPWHAGSARHLAQVRELCMAKWDLQRAPLMCDDSSLMSSAQCRRQHKHFVAASDLQCAPHMCAPWSVLTIEACGHWKEPDCQWCLCDALSRGQGLYRVLVAGSGVVGTSKKQQGSRCPAQQ